MRFRQKFSILVSLYGDDQNSPGISIVYAYIFRPGRAGPQWDERARHESSKNVTVPSILSKMRFRNLHLPSTGIISSLCRPIGENNKVGDFPNHMDVGSALFIGSRSFGYIYCTSYLPGHI